jgi:regulator of sigma E protease
MFLMNEVALIILSIIAFIVIISVIVALHELGHFIVATKFKVLCYEYSIGMGPIIYKKKSEKSETQFSIRAVPLGGYVSMAGEDILADDIKKEASVGVNFDDDDKVSEIILDPNQDAQARGKCIDIDLIGKDQDELYITLDVDGEENQYTVNPNATYIFEKNSRLQIAPYERTIDAKPVWQRILIYLAGPLMNFILAIFIYLIVAFSTGVQNLSSNKIGGVSENYPAYGVLQEGDEIKSVNGKDINSWTDYQTVSSEIYESYETTLTIKILRDSEEKEFVIEAYTGYNSIGLSNYNLKQEELKLQTIPGTEVQGLKVGVVGLRYKNSSDEKYEKNIAKDDYITEIKIDNKEVVGLTSWGQLSELITSIYDKESHEVRFTYYHKNGENYEKVDYNDCKIIEPYTSEVLTSQNIDNISNYIGIKSTYHFDFIGCIGQAFSNFWNDFTLIFRTLKLLIAPSGVRQIGVQNLSSFVGIFAMIKKYIASGFLTLLSFAAMLSVNIGIVNLLPIPALDGGKILFALIELITKKKLPKKVEIIINVIFYVLLLGLLVYVTYNDILRL